MSGDYVERLRGLLSHLDEISRRAARARPGDTRTERQIVADLIRQSVDPAELRDDLRAALDELERLRASRTSLDGQVFVSGWYAHAEACASLGWDARQAAWRKYREEMTATLAEAVPPKPNGAPCCGGPHAGWIHTVACESPQQPERDGGA